MKQKLISMTLKEISRHNVIKNLIDGKINGPNTSKQICLSLRQVRRIKARVKKERSEGIIHGNRGRASNRRINSDIFEKIKKHLKEKYYDFGPTLAQEKLEEINKIEICNFGEMEQFDGSYHLWFGDFETCLLLSVDDATGKITHAKFYYNEGVQ